jgi:lipopolysaccharide transport system ATP-binding protein
VTAGQEQSAEIVITARNLGKMFRLYDRRRHRLNQLLFGWRRNYYEEFWAVRDCGFDIRRGETVGILGVNGAGKSTLLQLVCGVLRPSTGYVNVSGRIAALLSLGAGFHPQFTGRENVYLNASALGLSRQEIENRFERIAEFADIGEFMDLPVKLYSSGMYARLAFAVCANVDADILIVDEILSVGDNVFAQKCQRYLNRFREHGTVLFVSHSTAMVASLCDRVLWLEHGRLREHGAAAEVCAHYLASLSDADEDRPAFHVENADGRWWAPPAPPLLSDVRRHKAGRIVISEFDPFAPFHGYGGAVIDDVALHVPGGCRISEMSGGDEVELRIAGHATREIGEPMVGFILRDRYGQGVFGDNSYVHCRNSLPSIAVDEGFEGVFRFQMPWLADGNYSVTVAFVEGTQDDHTHLHWIEDSLILNVAGSRVARGIVALPASDIRIEVAGAVG